MALMVVLMVLSLPTLFLSASGSKLTVDQMDPMGLGVFTLGNNGTKSRHLHLVQEVY